MIYWAMQLEQNRMRIKKKRLNRRKKIRNTLKMSQYKIAESIDINQSTWWAYENGKTLITTINLTTLCKKFNLSTYRILNNNN